VRVKRGNVDLQKTVAIEQTAPKLRFVLWNVSFQPHPDMFGLEL